MAPIGALTGDTAYWVCREMSFGISGEGTTWQEIAGEKNGETARDQNIEYLNRSQVTLDVVLGNGEPSR